MNGVFIQSSKDPRFRACILRLKALKEQRKTLTDSRQKHNCHPNFCKPENESDNNIPNPIACNIFICRYGSVHFCTAEDCGLYGGSLNGTCPISGIQHNALDISGYDKEKSHTWYRQHEERRADVQTVTARFLLSGKEEIEEKQGYDVRLDDAEGAKHGKKKQDMKQRRADSLGQSTLEHQSSDRPTAPHPLT